MTEQVDHAGDQQTSLLEAEADRSVRLADGLAAEPAPRSPLTQAADQDVLGAPIAPVPGRGYCLLLDCSAYRDPDGMWHALRPHRQEAVAFILAKGVAKSGEILAAVHAKFDTPERAVTYSSISNLFQGHPAYGTLVVKTGHGFFRLADQTIVAESFPETVEEA